MSKHTQGPWVAASLAPHGHPVRIVGNTKTVAIVPEDDTLETKTGRIVEYVSPEGIANARLIAAAPDLLEALKTVASERDFVVRCNDHIQSVVRTAIAKAVPEDES